MVLGRRGRKWWKTLPESEKSYLRNHLKQNRLFIGVGSIAFAVFGIGGLGYGSVSLIF